MKVYAVVFDPQGFCSLKGIYKTANHARQRVLELAYDEHVYPCDVIECEVEE